MRQKCLREGSAIRRPTQKSKVNGEQTAELGSRLRAIRAPLPTEGSKKQANDETDKEPERAEHDEPDKPEDKRKDSEDAPGSSRIPGKDFEQDPQHSRNEDHRHERHGGDPGLAALFEPLLTGEVARDGFDEVIMKHVRTLLFCDGRTLREVKRKDLGSTDVEPIAEKPEK
jgi:hypothetical protein